jgi:nucleoside-diphosphate-sugar epimerase
MLTDPPVANSIRSVEHLEHLLSEPTDAVVDLMRRLPGDIMLLGVGGKIGPSLALMAKRASDLAGTPRRIIGVSRFSSSSDQAFLASNNLETIQCDLLDEEAVEGLPAAANVIYLAGLKFGSTWAMNTWLPSVICRKFRTSRIVAYSTGGVYGLTAPSDGGSSEADAPEPVGEYAMSCLGRERMFEYFSKRWGTPVAIIRLFYACEVRYGVLVDLARKVALGEPIDLSMGYFNVIWQGDNNAMTLLALEQTSSPPRVLNVTGPEILSIRAVAETMGQRMGKSPVFLGQELGTSCLGNSHQAQALFGPPRIKSEELMDWAVDWVERGGEYLGKPTHFETRDGKY